MSYRENCKRVYILKTVTSDVYKWSPGCPDFSKKKLQDNRGSGKINPPICTAVAGSQGQDFTTTYVYDAVIVGYEEARLAYVECDYVE
jgi:hypothetical protein